MADINKIKVNGEIYGLVPLNSSNVSIWVVQQNNEARLAALEEFASEWINAINVEVTAV